MPIDYTGIQVTISTGNIIDVNVTPLNTISISGSNSLPNFNYVFRYETGAYNNQFYPLDSNPQGILQRQVQLAR